MIVVFLSGGVGRLVERPGSSLRDVRAVVILRLRLLAFFLGPVLGLFALDLLPLVDRSSALPAVAWGWALVGVGLVTLAVVYGGLTIRRAAAREGVSLWLALRFPTGSSHFANAAALPWAKTIFVTDRLVESISPEALDAVLAHEAAHLAEGPRVLLLRLSAPVVLVSGVGIGGRIADATPFGTILVSVSVLVGLVLFVLARRVARRMEERADAHAKEHVGAAALAEALLALQRENRSPLTSSSKRRVHPDLYDRITACGHDLGPRPAAPETRIGVVAGLALGAVLGVLAYGASTLTTIEPGSIAMLDASAALRRQRIDPWDPNAMLALGWASRRDEAFAEADARIEAAEWLGAPRPEVYEARAELAAARGHCEEADALFDESISARSMAAFETDPFAPLELGGWHLPPSLVSECRRSVEDLAPGPDPFDMLELDAP